MRTVNLIPMAGAGKRFVEAGYPLPKPLITVGGVPMIVRAAQSLPSANQWIFVCRQEHIEEYRIDAVVKVRFPGAEVIPAPCLTSGQAATCLLGKALLQDDDCVTIGACDNAMQYSFKKWESLIQKSNCDAIVWTFRNNPAVLQGPTMYSWVDVDLENRVRRVSVKVPISPNPMRDHAVIGAFSFKRARDFISCAETMIQRERRVNGEFYVDEVVNLAVEQGLRVYVFEVDCYICWGTPQDLATYEYWRNYFAHELPLSSSFQNQECSS